MIPLRASFFGQMSMDITKSFHSFNGYNEVIDENDYLSRSPTNARRLLEPIEEVEKVSIKEVFINSIFEPHKQRNFSLLKIKIKLPDYFRKLDNENIKLFTV